MIRLKIKEAAQAKNISQRQLSIRTQIDIKTIQKIYRYPTRIITTETLDRIAKVLNVDASELIESVPDNTTDEHPASNRLSEEDTDDD